MLLAAAVLWAGPQASSAAPAVRSRAVIAAIKSGADALLRMQQPGKMWESGHFGAGTTFNSYGAQSALATEALLYVAQSLHLPELNIFSPKMRAAINFLVQVKPLSTYTASFQANALTLLPPKRRYRRAIERDAYYLLHTIHLDGGYTYTMPFPLPRFPAQYGQRRAALPWDNSNTQYGILGMWACAHAGLEIPGWYWRLARKHWVICQRPDGSWPYYAAGWPNYSSAGSMTPAGLASLFICDEYLLQRPRVTPVNDPFIVRGLAWLKKHFSPTERNFYIMYGDERVALASGIQTIGGHNWYNDFASTLLAADGNWRGSFVWDWATPSSVYAYALMVLDRGLNPVVINKLQYTNNFFGNWNARQRDVANFVSWLTKTYETPLNWQVVNIHSPMKDWLNAPILLITGHNDPHFTKAQMAKLRQYVQDGGLVLCSPDGGSGRFRLAMLKYGREVARGRYQFKRCSPGSYIYTTLPLRRRPRVHNFMAISNGIRYLWIVSPMDLGGVWQSHQFARRDYWTIPANMYYYAIGKQALSNRLESLVVPPPASPPARKLTVCRLKYRGNWNPEPGAWPRMAKIAATDFQTQVTLENRSVNASLDPAKDALAVMTGTAKFKLSPRQLTALRNYLVHGGMLLADAGGGHRAFTDSFVKLVGKLFPHKQLDAIPAGASLYVGNYPGGASAVVVQYRKFYNQQHPHVRNHPQLLGVKLHGRWVVVFSAQDITSGFLGTNTWGINGYTPASAQALARNILTYAVHH